jgi:DNA-binding GntR family transcriptional regulator
VASARRFAILYGQGTSDRPDTVFLPAVYGVVLDRLERDDTLVCSLVESSFGVTTHAIHQEICAVEISTTVAKLLNVKPKSPGLAMLRRYVGEKNETYKVTWSIHPANRHKYDMKMVRSYGLSNRG